MGKLSYKVIFIALNLVTTTNMFSQVMEPEEIFEKVNNSIVTVFAYDDQDIKISQGSGVIIDTGLVVTNFHVYQGCNKIRIQHYGKEYNINRIIGVDIENDVIICLTDKELVPLEIELANETRIGERIYAIGSPLGYENSITEGLISGIRAIDDGNLLQISTPISFGSSGGAVINSRGKLIGISTAGYLYSDINFAIPINKIYSLASNCALEDTICSLKLHYFLKCYQAYFELNFNEAFVQLNNYINIDSGKILQSELEYSIKIIVLNLLFEVNYTTTQFNSIMSLFRNDANFVAALDNVNLLLNGNDAQALQNFLVLSKKNPNNPNLYYCLGRCYESMGDKKTQLEYFYKKAFFLGRKDLGYVLLKEGIITELQLKQFR
ncbi:MAG: trypsin-like peptidase domain-containing protein [Ignavibacteriaceae bacterium]|jgi:tetratricopeptide (TPR) repeat protein|nr:trypsin-like peptidase domain-containing protein [Ignavibacteriaceae bacterium]MCW9065571.1 trypsin-like peptidase domain-containing protein [Ignavibacteriaceae bacterium]